MVGSESQRHHQLGGGHFFCVRDGRNQGQNQHVVAGVTAAHQAGADHYHNNQERVALVAAPVHQGNQGVFHFVHSSGLLNARQNHHKTGDHDDAGVGETREGLGYGRQTGGHQQHARQKGRRAEGKYVKHDQRNHNNQDCKSKNHLGCHFIFLLLLCFWPASYRTFAEVGL